MAPDIHASQSAARRLVARRRGPRVGAWGRAATGTVAGCFSASLAWRAADGRLYSVAPPRYGNHPACTMLDDDAWVIVRRSDIRAGAPVIYDDREIRFPGHGLVVDFAAAEPWQPVPEGSVVMRSWDEAVVRLVLDLIDTSGLVRGPAAGGAHGASPDPFATVPIAAVEALQAASVAHDERAMAEAAHSLLGLGIGLTPCGDDVVIGALGALVLVEERTPWLRRVFDSVLAAAPAATNGFSLEFFRQVAEGLVFEQLGELVATFAGGDLARVRQAATAMLDYGATSGRFMTLGALASMTAIQGQETGVLRSWLSR